MIKLPVNPLPGVETNDDWVAWLTIILIYLLSKTYLFDYFQLKAGFAGCWIAGWLAVMLHALG